MNQSSIESDRTRDGGSIAPIRIALGPAIRELGALKVNRELRAYAASNSNLGRSNACRERGGGSFGENRNALRPAVTEKIEVKVRELLSGGFFPFFGLNAKVKIRGQTPFVAMQ